MNAQILGFALAALFGAAIGFIWFGMLWLTVRRVDAWRYPGIVFLASFVIRLGMLSGSMFLLTRQGWSHLAAGVFGLLAARAVWLRRSRTTT